MDSLLMYVCIHKDNNYTRISQSREVKTYICFEFTARMSCSLAPTTLRDTAFCLNAFFFTDTANNVFKLGIIQKVSIYWKSCRIYDCIQTDIRIINPPLTQWCCMSSSLSSEYTSLQLRTFEADLMQTSWQQIPQLSHCFPQFPDKLLLQMQHVYIYQ